MLAELGLFIGARTDHNNESPLFLALERRLLRQSSGSWQCPEALHPLLENAAARAMATEYFHRTLVSHHVIGYLGWSRYLRYRTPANLDIPWGWKSPVTTYTLPLWLELFPEARVIHLCRHGVDVAQSLRVRAEREQEAVRRRLHVSRKLLYWHWRIIPLERGFSLWEAYVTQARQHVHALWRRTYELKYEDVLADPMPALRSLVTFCGLQATEEEITRVARRVRPERAYAYQGSPELRHFAVRVAPRLHALGYATMVPTDSGRRPVHVPARGDTPVAVGR
jgi:hypothetical protein